MEKADYSLSYLDSLLFPVPTAPVWFISDTAYFASAGSRAWEWEIPPDDHVWSITDFVMIADEITWLVMQIKINDTVVYYQIDGWPLQWHPARDRTVMLTYPDKIKLTMAHIASNPHNYYWSMNFYRAPQRS